MEENDRKRVTKSSENRKAGEASEMLLEMAVEALGYIIRSHEALGSIEWNCGAAIYLCGIGGACSAWWDLT